MKREVCIRRISITLLLMSSVKVNGELFQFTNGHWSLINMWFEYEDVFERCLTAVRPEVYVSTWTSSLLC